MECRGNESDIPIVTKKLSEQEATEITEKVAESLKRTFSEIRNQDSEHTERPGIGN